MTMLREHLVRMGPPALGAAVAACLLLLACPAGADSLSFTSIAGCPSREMFLAGVQARTPLARFSEGHGGRSFLVSLASSRSSRASEPFLGSLVLVSPEGDRTTREVDGATCEEVADALSLIVALTIDPNARTDALPAPALPPQAASSPPMPAPRAPSSPRASSETRLALEAFTGLGAAPNPTLGAGVDLGFQRRAADRASRGVAFALGGHVRASVEKTVFSAIRPSADMVRVLGAAGPCPIEAHAGPVQLEACVGLAMGFARFEGEGAPIPSAKVRFWSHAEAGLLTSFSLGPSTFFRLRATLEVPLVRDELVFVRPDIFVHRASPVTGSFGGSFEIRL